VHTASLKAILFDAGRVLVLPDDEAFRQAAAALGHVLAHGVAVRALAQTVWAGARHPDPVRFWSEDLYLSIWSKLIGQSHEAGAKIWQLADSDHVIWGGVDDDTRPALHRLLDSGLKLGVVSNSDGRLAKRLADARLADNFACTYSAGVRAGGSHAPVVNSSRKTSSLSIPHLMAVSR
jgi:FMN phosphatase YigB (HAD superfamily)